MFTSITHFWNPDWGDEHVSNIHAKSLIEDFWIRVPNSYQRMLKYVNGDWNLNIPLVVWGLPTKPDGSGGCATQRAIVTFKYNSLIDLYKNKSIWLIKVTWINGQSTTYNNPIKFTSDYWNETMRQMNGFSYSEFLDIISWEVLGRMCHLLQDISVPAHSHLDEHSPLSRGDSYETYMQSDRYWKGNNISGTIQNPFISSNPIHYLMYTTAQMAGHYGTNGPYEGDGNNILGGNPTVEEISYLTSVGFPNLGGQTGMKHPLVIGEIIGIRDKMIPQAIRSTAGLLYWFLIETNLIIPQTVDIRKEFELDQSETSTSQYFPGGCIYVPDQIIKNNKIYNFANWIDGVSDNPRNPSGVSLYTAIYKVHLKSNTANVTSAYTQNRLATSWSSVNWYKQMMIYESAGEIWSSERTYSNGSFSSWSNERRISAGNGSNRSPSIISSNSYTYYAVWERYVNGVMEIYFSKNYYGNWEIPKKIVNFSTNFMTSRPVIWDFPNRIHVYYQRTSNSFYSCQSIDGGTTWSSGYSLSGFSYPSLDGNYNYLSSSAYYLTRLYFLRNFYPNDCTGCWNEVELIPGSNWIDYSGQGDLTGYSSGGQQVRATFSRDYVAWLLYLVSDDEHYYYVVQSRDWNGNWSSAYAYGVSNPYAELSGPTLAIDDHIICKTYMLWSDAGQMKKVSGNYNTGAWNSNVTNIGSGRFPVFEHAKPFLGNSATYIYSTYQSPLYNLNTNVLSTSLGKTTEETETKNKLSYARVIYAVDTVTNQSLSIRISQPILGNKLVNFVTVNDTLPGINESNFFSYLNTEGLKLESDSDTLEFDLSIYSKNFTDIEFSIPLSVNAGINESFFQNAVSTNYKVKEKHKTFLVKKVIKNLRNKELELNLINELPKLPGNNWIYGIAHVYDEANESRLAKELISGEITTELPTEYSIANFPNPFNPITVMRYELPQDGFVTLKIYDMLGREVRTLVNEAKATGRYEVEFNASDLASGIYIYQIRVNNFNSAKKILLIK